MNDRIARAAELIQESRHAVAFTGSGISEESGIPTYRGAGGLWQKYDPDKYASPDYFLQDPSYYWQFFRELRRPMLETARPNQAHLALARLEEDGRLEAVITQNIDGLHQAAGSKRVIELHGTVRHAFCMDCRKDIQIQEVLRALDVEIPPRCASCGGILRPAVIFFGESLSQPVLEDAISTVGQADLVIVVGSSLVVYPAASFPEIAHANGAHMIIVNVDPTPADSIADIVFHDRAGSVFPQIIAGFSKG